jgi:hypothetical protein
MESSGSSLPISVSFVPSTIPNEIPNEDTQPVTGIHILDTEDTVEETIGLDVETPGFQSLEFDPLEQEPPPVVPIASEGLLNDPIPEPTPEPTLDLTPDPTLDTVPGPHVCRMIKLNTSDIHIRNLLDQGAIILADPSGDGSAILVPPCSMANPQVVVQDSDAMVEVVNTENT